MSHIILCVSGILCFIQFFVKESSYQKDKDIKIKRKCKKKSTQIANSRTDSETAYEDEEHIDISSNEHKPILPIFKESPHGKDKDIKIKKKYKKKSIQIANSKTDLKSPCKDEERINISSNRHIPIL